MDRVQQTRDSLVAEPYSHCFNGFMRFSNLKPLPLWVAEPHFKPFPRLDKGSASTSSHWDFHWLLNPSVTVFKTRCGSATQWASDMRLLNPIRAQIESFNRFRWLQNPSGIGRAPGNRVPQLTPPPDNYQ